ncbi:UNVERIFIED_CONTAM: YSIRK-type signal peptide-containing protein [Streptococcus canis]|uniref:YSIRK-type signal peptide-containing protein n=1 Tax=Streptococcus canis TaxID=1329 RepID=A0AAE4Q6U2_STRCB|nr:YSIRK-type signal peptide-containing protein [Streptococcus canis]
MEKEKKVKYFLRKSAFGLVSMSAAFVMATAAVTTVSADTVSDLKAELINTAKAAYGGNEGPAEMLTKALANVTTVEGIENALAGDKLLQDIVIIYHLKLITLLLLLRQKLLQQTQLRRQRQKLNKQLRLKQNN